MEWRRDGAVCWQRGGVVPAPGWGGESVDVPGVSPGLAARVPRVRPVLVDRAREETTMKDYRILVTGSRSWTNAAVIRSALYRVCYSNLFDRCVVVHGFCESGADAIADRWCLEHEDLGVRVERHPAAWDVHGRSAGPIRNEAMVKLGADVCLAFIKDGSPGASHCMAAARKALIPVTAWFVASN